MQMPKIQTPNIFRSWWVPYIGPLIPNIRIAIKKIPVDTLCTTPNRFQSTFYLGSPIPNIQIPIIQIPDLFTLQWILWLGLRIPDIQIQYVETPMDFLFMIPIPNIQIPKYLDSNGLSPFQICRCKYSDSKYTQTPVGLPISDPPVQTFG